MSNKRIQIGKASAKKKDAKRDDFHDGKKGIVGLGAGDSFYIPNFLHNTRKENEAIMARLMQEVEFVQMFYFKEGGSDVQPVPRMVSAQTTKKSGTSAIYRMPGCNEKNIETKEWSPTVRYICEKASEELKQDFNHCVCNLYRDQEDSLGLHYDKLLDLEDQSLILSISFGAARPFVFVGSKTKSKKETKTIIMLQPGSLIAIGPKTNRLYQHGIPKVAEEVGPRISLSLRTISTFVKEAPAAPATVAPEYPLATTAPAKPQDKEFEIMGRGEEFQTRNYPFVKNYAEAEEEWSDTIKAKIQKFKEDSEQRFKALRAQFSPDESPMEEEEDGDDNEVEAKLVY